MPNIQVVVNRITSLVVYLGYDQARAKELFLSNIEYMWYQTDKNTNVELTPGVIAGLAFLLEKNPDLRFTQIISLIETKLKEKFNVNDIYYLEDSEVVDIIDDIIRESK